MNRKPPPPTAPAELVKGMTAERAIEVLRRQLERYDDKAVGLLMDADTDPDPEQARVIMKHVKALRAELLIQERREAALN